MSSCRFFNRRCFPPLQSAYPQLHISKQISLLVRRSGAGARASARKPPQNSSDQKCLSYNSSSDAVTQPWLKCWAELTCGGFFSSFFWEICGLTMAVMPWRWRSRQPGAWWEKEHQSGVVWSGGGQDEGTKDAECDLCRAAFEVTSRSELRGNFIKRLGNCEQFSLTRDDTKNRRTLWNLKLQTDRQRFICDTHFRITCVQKSSDKSWGNYMISEMLQIILTPF